MIRASRPELVALCASSRHFWKTGSVQLSLLMSCLSLHCEARAAAPLAAWSTSRLHEPGVNTQPPSSQGDQDDFNLEVDYRGLLAHLVPLGWRRAVGEDIAVTPLPFDRKAHSLGALHGWVVHVWA
jgi:hypothetical protein